MKGPSVSSVGWGAAGPGVTWCVSTLWGGGSDTVSQAGAHIRAPLCCGYGGLDPLRADAAHLSLKGVRVSVGSRPCV